MEYKIKKITSKSNSGKSTHDVLFLEIGEYSMPINKQGVIKKGYGAGFPRYSNVTEEYIQLDLPNDLIESYYNMFQKKVMYLDAEKELNIANKNTEKHIIKYKRILSSHSLTWGDIFADIENTFDAEYDCFDFYHIAMYGLHRLGLVPSLVFKGVDDGWGKHVLLPKGYTIASENKCMAIIAINGKNAYRIETVEHNSKITHQTFYYEYFNSMEIEVL